MKIILSLILALLSSYSWAQKEDANKIVTEAIEYETNSQNPKECLDILHKAMPYADDVADSIAAKYYFSFGRVLGMLGSSDSSIIFLDKSESITSSINGYFQLMKINNLKGHVYMDGGKYEESLKHYQKALKIGEQFPSIKFQRELQLTLGNAAGVFYDLKDYASAINFTLRSLEISKNLNLTSDIVLNKLRLAIIYKDTDSLALSSSYLLEISEPLKKEKDTLTLLYVKNTLGAIYEKSMKYDSAKMYYLEAIQLATLVEIKEEILQTQLSLANLYLTQKKYKAAENQAKKVAISSRSDSYSNILKKALDIIYQVALAENSYKKALQYRNEYLMLSDSLASADVRKEIANLQTKYETVQKEAKIEKLTLTNQLQNANLAKSRNAQIAIAISSGLILLLVIVYFVLNQKKIKAEKEAQELQVEALKKRFIELHAGPSELAVEMNLLDLNSKLHTQLTEREFDALKLSIEGKTNVEIGENLFISVSTVKFHLRNTYNKMGVSNRKEAFQFMLKTS